MSELFPLTEDHADGPLTVDPCAYLNFHHSVGRCPRQELWAANHPYQPCEVFRRSGRLGTISRHSHLARYIHTHIEALKASQD